MIYAGEMKDLRGTAAEGDAMSEADKLSLFVICLNLLKLHSRSHFLTYH